MTEQTIKNKKKFKLTTEKFLVAIIIVYCIVVACVNSGFLTPATLYDMVISAC